MLTRILQAVYVNIMLPRRFKTSTSSSVVMETFTSVLNMLEGKTLNERFGNIPAQIPKRTESTRNVALTDWVVNARIRHGSVLRRNNLSTKTFSLADN